MIKQVFVTEDGVQHETMRQAEHHEGRTALRRFMEARLDPRTLWDEEDNAYLDRVGLDEVIELISQLPHEVTELVNLYNTAAD